MARDVYIFIKTDASPAELVNQLNQWMNWKLSYTKNDYVEWHEQIFREDNFVITLHKNHLLDDMDIPFERFDYYLDVLDVSDQSYEKWLAWINEVPKSIFLDLCSLKVWELMFTIGTQNFVMICNGQGPI
ncbi:hypothetical protein [Haliscomenobacter sp.]|uniref:hypothetical protein n=1 Tax=Haliscomenobacter sp. TaxID=2717303 RepID=UPI003BAC0015